MKVYLAGIRTPTGAKPAWKKVVAEIEKEMRIYLAGSSGRRKLLIDALRQQGIDNMKLYLSGTDAWKYVMDGTSDAFSLKTACEIYVLESFAYISADDVLIPLIPFFKGFLLDSGAFTFLQQSGGKNVDFDKYLNRYIDFINEYDIQNFFELDIDAVVGYEKVLEYRKILEEKTGKKCIPVWHRSRGKKEFLKMCEEYPYVALGGIAIKEISQAEYKYFPWFIREAHKRGAQIHALGFTSRSELGKYHFDSVDSSSWTAGNRFGYIYKFTGKTLKRYHKPEGMRVKTWETAINNFTEWVKFAKYAETHY